ncbi:hypothetical protein V4210_02205 [Candidatus Nanosynbacter sp. BB002]|uniref:hypothetical protein n=1 Tax=Candidatus Nanosynbacter sp. BB002 TaxID=3393757 RepID=UPI0030D52BA4
MALGFPNSNGGRTTDSALFHALGNAFVGSWISGFRVRQASPVGMNVLIGGENGIPDDLLVRDAMSATFPVSNLSTQPVQASVTTANSANPRIDAVVIYIDTNVAASQAVANNENRTKAVVVPGTPATNPSAPTPSQIKAKIGASNPYEVIAEIRVNAGTTTILDSVITDRRNPATLADGRINRAEMFKNGVIGSDALGNDIVLPRHLSSSALLAFSADGVSQSVTGNILVQTGWVQFWGNSTKRQPVPVVFPKQFKQVFSMSPTLIGYKTGGKATSISEFNQVIGSGLNIESGVVTNTGTTLNASTTGIFGGAWHGISWVAIGIV